MFPGHSGRPATRRETRRPEGTLAWWRPMSADMTKEEEAAEFAHAQSLLELLRRQPRVPVVVRPNTEEHEVARPPELAECPAWCSANACSDARCGVPCAFCAPSSKSPPPTAVSGTIAPPCATFPVHPTVKGAMNDGRRCGQCCGARGDMTSAMCNGSSADGLLTVSQDVMEERCASDRTCVGFYSLWGRTRAFRPVTSWKGHRFGTGWDVHAKALFRGLYSEAEIVGGACTWPARKQPSAAQILAMARNVRHAARTLETVSAAGQGAPDEQQGPQQGPPQQGPDSRRSQYRRAHARRAGRWPHENAMNASPAVLSSAVLPAVLPSDSRPTATHERRILGRQFIGSLRPARAGASGNGYYVLRGWYSQLGQDRCLAALFAGSSAPGYYVDLAANHPIALSNVRWILLEPARPPLPLAPPAPLQPLKPPSYLNPRGRPCPLLA